MAKHHQDKSWRSRILVVTHRSQVHPCIWQPCWACARITSDDGRKEPAIRALQPRNWSGCLTPSTPSLTVWRMLYPLPPGGSVNSKHKNGHRDINLGEGNGTQVILWEYKENSYLEIQPKDTQASWNSCTPLWSRSVHTSFWIENF